MKQRFFVLESSNNLGFRFVFEVYETFDRVTILATNAYDGEKRNHYSNHTIAEARDLWKSYTIEMQPEHTFTRNHELEKELNASR